VTIALAIPTPPSEATSKSTAFAMLGLPDRMVAPVWGVLPVHTRSQPATQAAVFVWQISFPPRLGLFPMSVKNAQLAPLLAQEAMSR